jgi:adenylate cyclase
MEVSGKWSIPLAGLGMGLRTRRPGGEAHDAIGEVQKVAHKSYAPPAMIAMIHAMCGEKYAALEWAGMAVEQRDPLILPAKVHPGFDRIRDDPRFEALLRRMNLA